MTLKIHPDPSQSLASEANGELNDTENKRPHKNDKPIIVKVTLHGWMQTAVIVVVFAVVFQALLTGLNYAENHRDSHRVSASTPPQSQVILRALAAGEFCDTAGAIFYDDLHNTLLSCIWAKWVDSTRCENEGQSITDMDGEALVCKMGRWSPVRVVKSLDVESITEKDLKH